MGSDILPPNPWMILPFIVLLASIALSHLFVSDRCSKHYPKVVIGLGMVTLGYCLLGLYAYTRVFHVGLEYLSFIALIGSLFVV